MPDAQEHRNRLNGGAEGVARHGIARPRGEVNLVGTGSGRFSRMFPLLPRQAPDAGALQELAERLINRTVNSGFNRGIPAGYTYLGQFVDHDITFDPTSKLERDNDPEALVNFRTPRFDLDSLYGSGPADQSFLYDWCSSPRGVKLLVGQNPDDRGYAAVDLPRNWQGRALIGDSRNDENLIISQLHLLFIHFHNKVVERVLGTGRAEDPFGEAQQLVRWHYQWIVMHDFLPKIIGRDPPILERRFYAPSDEASIPVEFSGAAFRFGHSMVREDYGLNDTHPSGVPTFPREGRSLHLGGLRRLPAELTVDWGFFFRTRDSAPQSSMLIDTSLAKVLTTLPDERGALARLNLQRGLALGLPRGVDVALALGESPLTAEELNFGGIQPLTRISLETSDALVEATPLWFYILREAEVREKGKHLGPVGGRIVAEVLTGLLEADPSSYLRQFPNWQPKLRGTDGSFTMADLVRFTEDDG